MRCYSYGFTIPGTDSRLFPNPTRTFDRRLCPVKPPSLSMKVKVKAKLNDGVCFKEMTEMSFYELLGIPESGSLMEIKQAYKQLARKYHPDVSPPDRVDEYTKRFIRVQEAYETLSDPRLRELYDRDMFNSLNLAFSARRRYPNDMDGGIYGWKNCWESQLSELKRRSDIKETEENMSWGARMRRQRESQSAEM